MIRSPGIEDGGFVVTPDSVWYARVLLLFSASAQTDTGSKTFDCALVSTLETYNDPENCNYCHYCYYLYFMLLLLLLDLLVLFRMVKISWLSTRIRARPQKPDSVRHTNTENPGKTVSCTRQRHRDNSTPPAQRLSWRARRPQAGCLQWMPHVVCQLVGIGMVLWYVVQWRGVTAIPSCHIMMEKGSMWARCSSMFGALSLPHRWSGADSNWFSRQCSGINRCWQGMGRCSSTVVISRGLKYGAPQWNYYLPKLCAYFFCLNLHNHYANA